MTEKPSKAQNRRKWGRDLYERGTPVSISKRILDHLYLDLRENRISALLLISISKDLNKVIYNY